MQYKIVIFLGLSVVSVGASYALSVAHSLQDTNIEKAAISALAAPAFVSESETNYASPIKRPLVAPMTVTVAKRAEPNTTSVLSSARPSKRPAYIATLVDENRLDAKNSAVTLQISTKNAPESPTSQRPLSQILTPYNEALAENSYTNAYKPAVPNSQKIQRRSRTVKPWIIGAFR
ncbi:TPA: hypothetical protein EYP66_05310 [Candidatus Poribacteria bacterium]|nr:hypothetical protein [Candidatus Poribacteria bacterium]